MKDSTVKITVEMSEEEAWAIAQAFKRAWFDVWRDLSDPNDENEPYIMQNAASKIRKALAEKGISPR